MSDYQSVAEPSRRAAISSAAKYGGDRNHMSSTSYGNRPGMRLRT